MPRPAFPLLADETVFGMKAADFDEAWPASCASQQTLAGTEALLPIVTWGRAASAQWFHGG